MKFFRHALFALLLLLAQSGALAHAFEHLQLDGDTPASHACSLCLATQGLDAALAATAPAIALHVAGFALATAGAIAVFSAPALAPRARAPPTA